jgi:ribosomal protein S27AE
MRFEEAARAEAGRTRVDESKPDAEHHSVYCPNCSDRLTGHKCKLICQRCGYYLSCADYY